MSIFAYDVLLSLVLGHADWKGNQCWELLIGDHLFYNPNNLDLVMLLLALCAMRCFLYAFLSLRELMVALWRCSLFFELPPNVSLISCYSPSGKSVAPAGSCFSVCACSIDVAEILHVFITEELSKNFSFWEEQCVLEFNPLQLLMVTRLPV